MATRGRCGSINDSGVQPVPLPLMSVRIEQDSDFRIAKSRDSYGVPNGAPLGTVDNPIVLDYRSAVISRSVTTHPLPDYEQVKPQAVVPRSQNQAPPSPQPQVNGNVNSNVASVPPKLSSSESSADAEGETVHFLRMYIATLKQQMTYKDKKLHFLQCTKPRLSEAKPDEALKVAWGQHKDLYEMYTALESRMKVMQSEMGRLESLKEEMAMLEPLKEENVVLRNDVESLQAQNEAQAKEIMKLRGQLTTSRSTVTSAFHDQIRAHYEAELNAKLNEYRRQCMEFLNQAFSHYQKQITLDSQSQIPASISSGVATNGNGDSAYSTTSPTSTEFGYDLYTP